MNRQLTPIQFILRDKYEHIEMYVFANIIIYTQI